MKELNKILEIETRLLTVFHPQIDRQIEQINQELEKYLRFFTEYRQKEAGVDSNSGICGEQQGLFGNKSIDFHDKLQKRVKDGSKHQKKRKDREDNRIYRKNEESIRESRGSIKEGTRKNEKTSRQEMKKSGRMEERR